MDKEKKCKSGLLIIHISISERLYLVKYILTCKRSEKTSVSQYEVTDQ